MRGTQRNTIIDACRGFAILGVMAYHYLLRWPELYGYDRAYSPPIQLGPYGVAPFFVVSGLVISMAVLRCNGAREFVIRRFARLYPTFVVCALITFVLLRWGPEPFRRSGWDFLASLTTDASVFGRSYVDGAYWSLGVEAKFYAYIALSMLLFKKRFWAGILGFAFFAALPLGHPWSHGAIAKWWPYFLAGMAGWYLVGERQWRVSAALAIGSVVLYLHHRPDSMAVDLYVWGLTVSMLVALWWFPGWRPWPLRVLAWLGATAYSLYLLHQDLGVTLIGKLTELGVPDFAAVAVASVAMIALAHCVYRGIEKPMNRLLLRSVGEFERAVPVGQTVAASAG